MKAHSKVSTRVGQKISEPAERLPLTITSTRQAALANGFRADAFVAAFIDCLNPKHYTDRDQVPYNFRQMGTLTRNGELGVLVMSGC